jgi:hypothetical protein
MACFGNELFTCISHTYFIGKKTHESPFPFSFSEIASILNLLLHSQLPIGQTLSTHVSTHVSTVCPVTALSKVIYWVQVRSPENVGGQVYEQGPLHQIAAIALYHCV